MLDLEKVELAPLVRSVGESLQQKMGAAGVELKIEIPPKVSVLADARRLEQVFINLLDNAIKFNKPGGTITVRGGPDGLPGAMTRIEVSDTGIGIPAESLGKIFHRFYRVDRARSRDMGGTGLGLSIVKHLVRLQGGTVDVESVPGNGSSFILKLPEG